jgi:DNA-3-methyladenine glycosylase II
VADWGTGEPSFGMLGRMIAHQQLSAQAAATIWSRVEVHLGAVTPETLLAADFEALRACGFSRPKSAHLTSIAEAMVTGELNLARASAAELDSARAQLVSVRGIGPWTAELFLLCAVGAMDAFPVADVGLVEAHKNSARMIPKWNQRPSPRMPKCGDRTGVLRRICCGAG